MAKEAETKRGPGRPPGSKNKNTSGSGSKSSGSSGSGKSSGSSGSGKSSVGGSKGSKNVNAVRAASREPEDVKAAVRQEKIEQMQMQYDRDRRNVDVIWSITLFAVALFLFFTVVMDSTGSFGMRVHDICLGLFGHIAYALPFIVAIFAGLLLARKLQHFSGRTLTFSLLIILNMCMLNSYRYIDEKNIGIGFADVANYYVDGVKLDSGGAFGMWFGNLMVKFFGKPGLLIIAIAVLLICIFLVANSPISRFFDNLAKKHESRRLMREMDDAEMAKVQMAVAKTATPGADPVTGVVPKGARPVDMQYTIVEPSGSSPAEDPAERSLWRSILNGISKEEEPSAVPPKRGSFLSGGSDDGKAGEVSAAEAREYAAVRSGKNDSIVYTEPPASAKPKNSAASLLRALAADPDDDVPDLPPQKDDSVMQLFSRDTIFGKIKKKLSGTDPDIRMPKAAEEEEAAQSRFPEMSFADVDELDLGYPGRRIDREANNAASARSARGLDNPAAPSGTTGLGGSDSVHVNKSYGLSDDEGHSGTFGLDGHSGGTGGTPQARGLGELSWAGGNAATAGLGLRPSGSAAAQRTNSRSGRSAAARPGQGGSSVNSIRTSAGNNGNGISDGGRTGGTSSGSSAAAVNGRMSGGQAASAAATGLTADADEQDNNGRPGKTYRRSGKSEDLSQMTAEEAALADSFGAGEEDTAYTLPPVNLLKKSTASRQLASNVQLEEKANLLEKTLNDFGVDARVLTVTQGASVTRYEVQPATGVKVSKITSLADDIALNLRAKSIRIEAPIPGKAAVGIEVENDKPAPVLIRELIESEEFEEADSKLTFVVGKDISGNNIVADLKSMPHLLIAGATGSGKSVCINTIITSFLYKAKPSELKLIMIDPKVVELANYNGIPHLLTPVVTDARKASRALAIAVEEMDKRYELFAKAGVKDLESYNELMRAEHEYAMCKPQVVIIIDELADLMMVASSEVESSICRLAQKARAAGMHLIVATQRPSVDVVTGLIKANIPSRIAFSVASQIDSRTILDMTGAEKLLGKGDMLFSPVGSNKPYRVQGPFISDGETEKVIRFVKKEGGDAVYDEEIGNAIENTDKRGGSEPQDELTEDAIAYILKSRQASVSMLQRRFRIGYNRAARIIDEIEEKGIIGPSDGSRPRQVLLTEDEYYSGGANAQAAQETIDEISPQEKAELEAAVTGKPHMNLVRPAEAVAEPEPEEEDFESEPDDADVISEADAAVDYFNSLPESVRQILISNHNLSD